MMYDETQYLLVGTFQYVKEGRLFLNIHPSDYNKYHYFIKQGWNVASIQDSSKYKYLFHPKYKIALKFCKFLHKESDTTDWLVYNLVGANNEIVTIDRFKVLLRNDEYSTFLKNYKYSI